MQNISVIGLGKLGQPLAACLAYRGFDVLGVDIIDEVVDCVNAGIPTVQEPQLEEMIEGVEATTDHRRAIDETDVSMIMVPTPSLYDGSFSNNYVNKALQYLASALRLSDKPYHLFVINSTVMPASIDEQLIPLIEEVSERKVNDGFGICYCPETVALGNAVNGFLNPDMVIIGESDEKAGDIAEAIYGRLSPDAPIYRMSNINAEVAKISLNVFLTTKISFANMVGQLCEKVEGGNADVVTDAIGEDSRIGKKFLKAGPPYGGFCFPRDVGAYEAVARKHLAPYSLASAADYINQEQQDSLFRLVRKHSPEKKVSILGMAFKNGTPEIQASPGVALVRKLLSYDVEVTVYDPLALDNVWQEFGGAVAYTESVEECVSRSPVIVLMTAENWDLGNIDEPKTVIDCWRVLDGIDKKVKLVQLGVNG